MIAIIGECMLELTDVRFPGACSLRFGGDTLNTAVYLARAGIPCRFVTAVGHDWFSDKLLAAWKDEGIDTSAVLRHPTRIPGLYAIRTRADGEREFEYWRGQSAAAALFEIDGVDTILQELTQVELLYLTGVTLAVVGSQGRARIVALARGLREAGRRVAFDPNYRRQQWPTTAAAQAAFDEIASCASIVFAGMDDERAVRGVRSVSECFQHYRALGVRDIIVKDGAHGSTIFAASSSFSLRPTTTEMPLDTTGAGDAYNAAYIAATVRGESPRAAAAAAQKLAEVVIRHPGAITPREANRTVVPG